MNDPPPAFFPSGHPIVCVTWPSRCRAGSTSQISFIPSPYFCGSRPLPSPQRAIACRDSEPRTPSARKTYLPLSSIPGS